MGIIEIFKLFGSILVDNKEADKSISKTGKQADGLGKKLGKGIKTAGKWALGLGAAAAGVATAMFAMTKKVTTDFDRIAKDSKKLGITTDAFQEMEYWASQNGLSSNDMERAVGRLNQRIGLAVGGNKKYSDALVQLGVDMNAVKDGTVSTEDAMYQAISTLSQMTSEQEKSALASELFGTKLARELMPALQDGSLTLEDAAQKAKDLGIVIEEDTLKAAETFNDTWDDLTRSLGAFGQKILAELMPIFQTMMDWVIENMPAIQSVFQTVFDVVGGILGGFGDAIQVVIGWLSDWYTQNEESINGIWTTITEKIGEVETFLREVWGRIQEFWDEHGESIKEATITVFGEIQETIQTTMDAIEELLVVAMDIIVPFFEEKMAEISSIWKQDGEQMVESTQNTFEMIREAIEFVMPILEFLIDHSLGNIIRFFDLGFNTVMGLVKIFTGLFTGDWEKLGEGIQQIWDGAWDFIIGIIDGAWSLLLAPFGDLKDNITDWFTGLAKDAFSWGKNMISGFIDGIKSMGSKVKDGVSGVIGNVKGFLGFNSPAEEGEGRYITDWGANMVDGFLDGVKSETSEAEKVMNNLIGSMNPVNFRPAKPQSAVSENNNEATYVTNNFNIKADNLDEIRQVLEIFTGLKQTVRQG